MRYTHVEGLVLGKEAKNIKGKEYFQISYDNVETALICIFSHGVAMQGAANTTLTFAL